jgi:hypothetical protein
MGFATNHPGARIGQSGKLEFPKITRPDDFPSSRLSRGIPFAIIISSLDVAVDVLTLPAIIGSPEDSLASQYTNRACTSVGNLDCHGGHPPVEKQGFKTLGHTQSGDNFF